MYQVISLLVLPPAVFILPALLAFMFRSRFPRFCATVQITSLLLLYLFSTAQVGDRLLASLETFPALDIARLDAKANAAIVILAGDSNYTAPEYGGGPTVGALTLERLRYGAYLARQTGYPVLASGGEVDPGAGILSSMMDKSLRTDFNITPGWLEKKSRTTYENAFYSAEILKAANIETVYLVTHAWHMPRSAAVFEAAGLKVVAAPTAFTGDPSSEAWTFFPGRQGVMNSALASHEYIGRLWYWYRYKI